MVIRRSDNTRWAIPHRAMTALIAATIDQPPCVRAWPPIAEPSATPSRMADALSERRAGARSGAVATMRDCCGVIYDQPDKLQMTTITPKVTAPTGATTIVGNKTICARHRTINVRE